MNDTQRILLIDDDLDVGEFVAAAAEGVGVECIATSEAQDFLRALSPQITLVFLDLVMPHLDGIELLRLISQQEHRPPIVLMSGIGKRIVETAHRLGESLGLTIAAELQKPFRLTEVEAILRSHVQNTVPVPKTSNAKVQIDPSELAPAIKQNQFVLHYQPQIRITDGELTGVEALIRWQHPQHGLIFPDDFIPMAEQSGLMDEVTWTVAALALAEQQRFNQQRENQPIAISINVPAHSLRDLLFPDRLIDLAARYNVKHEHIVLEITESGLVNELSHTLDVLTRLRMKGIQLSIDDFGTGYSMLQQLCLIPATELKIDKSFVQNLQAADSDRVMVLKTIEIGHELGMNVVAEGVETEEQLEFLWKHCCDIAQGYFFSRPLPPTDFIEWMKQYRSHPISA